MKTFIRLVVAALGFGLAAPGLAHAQDAACQQALVNLNNAKIGKNPPVGVEADGLILKPRGEGYKAPADAAAFAVDTYREHGDVRYLCPKGKWPAEVTSANLKKALTAAAKAQPGVFCGGDKTVEASVPKIIRGHLNNAGPEFFADRILELQDKLDTTAGVGQQRADRHAADTEWLLEVITVLDSTCPNGEAALDTGSAKISAGSAHDFAVENVAFVECVKARDGWKTELAAFDGSPATDLAAMEAALAKLEKAAAPVKAACKASEEGSKENDYILAAKKMRILFLTTPGCREAAVDMNNIRQTMNGMSRESVPQYAGELRKAAKDAGVACKDSSAETWGNFVAWIGEKNMWRLPKDR